VKKAIVLLFMDALSFAFADQSTVKPSVSPTVSPKNVLFAAIKGTIDPATSSYLRAAIKEAENSRSEALVVELDTPGGLVSSVREMAQAIDTSTVPVVVFVTPAGAAATSAGALLMLASHVAAMSPGTNIGAAHPVNADGKAIEGAAGEKAVNDTAAFARGLAELRGRPGALAQAVVDKSRSFTAQEAEKEKLIDLLAADRVDLLTKLQGRTVASGNNFKRVLETKGAETRTFEMRSGQKLLHLLANPNIAAMLMAFAVLCIYVELTVSGVIIPGILGIISLIVAFISFQLVPIRTGGLILILLGVGMLIAEAFIVSHGALAAGGILSFLLGMLWVVDPAATDMRISAAVIVPIVVVLGAGVSVIAIAAARLKKSAEKALREIKGGGAFGLMGYPGIVESLNADGLSGKVQIRGELWDFRAAVPVKTGDSVEVIEMAGMVAVVRPVSGGRS
jgi:membrane-bound serine protease (ClpP class)